MNPVIKDVPHIIYTEEAESDPCKSYGLGKDIDGRLQTEQIANIESSLTEKAHHVRKQSVCSSTREVETNQLGVQSRMDIDQVHKNVPDTRHTENAEANPCKNPKLGEDIEGRLQTEKLAHIESSLAEEAQTQLFCSSKCEEGTDQSIQSRTGNVNPKKTCKPIIEDALEITQNIKKVANNSVSSLTPDKGGDNECHGEMISNTKFSLMEEDHHTNTEYSLEIQTVHSNRNSDRTEYDLDQVCNLSIKTEINQQSDRNKKNQEIIRCELHPHGTALSE